MKTTYPQISEWSVETDINSKSQTAPISNIVLSQTSNVIDKENSQDYIQIKSRFRQRCCQYWLSTTCCKGLIVGGLTADLVLAVLTTLWMTSGHRTIITTITTMNTLLITNGTNLTTTTFVTTAITSTTSTTMTTTISNKCTSGATYATQLMYLSLTATLPWTKYSFNYTSPNINSATLMFSFRNDPSFWYLDDVSVINSSGTQLLSNPGFETGDLSNWTYCNPQQTFSAGYVTGSISQSGNHCYKDGSISDSDYLSQTFTVVPNNNYSISFWLSATSSSSSFALVTLLN